MPVRMSDDDNDSFVELADTVEANLAIIAPVVLRTDDDAIENPAGPIKAQAVFGDVRRILFVIPFEMNCSHECIYRQEPSRR
ncbi:hypothetical protein J2045_002604 [Peteryoungia aggregata LMG 23059]|uniref:Uncharacterized protein n=1 Tax=Peteryoungia aggregata LMG 23059 TaxID=1368425 RepID=A0ABU0G919_9HYPH|nr:hypothetical protein [Peteryoungia aggregata LMG 23059]